MPPPFSASVVASLRGLWYTQEGRGSDMGLMERRSSALTVMGQDRTDSKDGASYLAWRGNSPAHPVAGTTLSPKPDKTLRENNRPRWLVIIDAKHRQTEPINIKRLRRHGQAGWPQESKVLLQH